MVKVLIYIRILISQVCVVIISMEIIDRLKNRGKNTRTFKHKDLKIRPETIRLVEENIGLNSL